MSAAVHAAHSGDLQGTDGSEEVTTKVVAVTKLAMSSSSQVVLSAIRPTCFPKFSDGICRIWKLQGRFHKATLPPSNELFLGDPSATACLAPSR